MFLGLDYGTAHLGVALAESSLAEPLTTLSTSTALTDLKQLITSHSVTDLVIGDCPTEFLDQLSSLGLPVHQVDETLTSHDARTSLMHTSQSRRKSKEHSVSAAIILQSYLDFSIT